MWRIVIKGTRTSTRRRVRIVFLSLVCVLLVAITVAILVRNPVIESMLERMLTKKMGTAVLIDNFHLGLLKPGISIDELTIQSHDDARVYLVKTGRIKVRIRLLPIITKRRIDISEMSLWDVHFLVPKDGVVSRRKQSSEVLQLLESVDINVLLNNYHGDIQSLALADKVLAQVNSAIVDGKAVIGETSKALETFKTDADTIVKSVRTVSNINQASRVLEKSTRLYNEANRMYERSLSAYAAIDTRATQIHRTAKNIPTIIEADVQKIVDDVTHPKRFAADVSIRIVKQLLASPVKKYHRILSGLLAVLDNMRETSTTDVKQSAGTSAVSDETQSSVQKLDKGVSTPIGNVSLRIGTFNLSVEYQTTSLFFLQASNITNQIYRSPEPVTFIVTTGDTPIAVAGRGSFTMNKHLPYMLRAKVEYSGIQARIESALSLIELERMDTTIQGAVAFELTNTTDGTASMTMRASDIQAVPRSDTDTDMGVGIASFLEGVSPVDIAANIGVSGTSIYSFSVHGDFTSRLAEVITPIVGARLASLKEQITKEVTVQITENTGQLLEEAKAQVDDALSSLGVEISSGKTLMDLLSNSQGDISAKVSEMSQEIMRKVAEEAAKRISEKVEKAVEDAVGSIKNSLPF